MMRRHDPTSPSMRNQTPAIIGNENPSNRLSSTAPTRHPIVSAAAATASVSRERATESPVATTTRTRITSAPVPTIPVSTSDRRYWLSKIWYRGRKVNRPRPHHGDRPRYPSATP